MDMEETIKTLKRNRDNNPNSPKFVKACNDAITALLDCKILQARCYVLSNGALCEFCRMKARCKQRRADD